MLGSRGDVRVPLYLGEGTAVFFGNNTLDKSAKLW